MFFFCLISTLDRILGVITAFLKLEKNSFFVYYFESHKKRRLFKIVLKFWILAEVVKFYKIRDLFNAEDILLKEQQWRYLTHSWENKGVYTFPKGICPKMIVIARLNIELTYYYSKVYRFNH